MGKSVKMVVSLIVTIGILHAADETTPSIPQKTTTPTVQQTVVKPVAKSSRIVRPKTNWSKIKDLFM